MSKRSIAIILVILVLTSIPGCAVPGEAISEPFVLGAKAYEYLQYIDSNLPDRDFIYGSDYTQAQQWIISELKIAGYSENDIHITEYETFENESVMLTAQNISVTKKGASGRQIIIGAHYDGSGTGDNGSGTALVLAAAAYFADAETYYDLTFVFFSVEEYGCYGSSAYAAAMSHEEIDHTLYMINIDTIIAGDYCYIYGGVADFGNKTVTGTEAYDNALETVNTLSLDIRSNPWTFENPEPNAEGSIPAFPSPSTGDWSDHYAFAGIGIPYVYFEATNWEIGEYDGYEETESFGPIMNTENDNLKKIEDLFPGRAQQHMKTFAVLLEVLLRQSKLPFDETVMQTAS